MGVRPVKESTRAVVPWVASLFRAIASVRFYLPDFGYSLLDVLGTGLNRFNYVEVSSK